MLESQPKIFMNIFLQNTSGGSLCHFNPIETSPLVCKINQMTGVYIKSNTALKWVNLERIQLINMVFLCRLRTCL